MTDAMGRRRCALECCGAILKRKPGEIRGNWQQRRFCDRSCASKANGAIRRFLLTGEVGPAPVRAPQPPRGPVRIAQMTDGEIRAVLVANARQRNEWATATERERRLFDPAIQEALRRASP